VTAGARCHHSSRVQQAGQSTSCSTAAPKRVREQWPASSSKTASCAVIHARDTANSSTHRDQSGPRWNIVFLTTYSKAAIWCRQGEHGSGMENVHEKVRGRSPAATLPTKHPSSRWSPMARTCSQQAAQQAISGSLTIVLPGLNNERSLTRGLGQHELAGGDHICRPRGAAGTQRGAQDVERTARQDAVNACSMRCCMALLLTRMSGR
jgi:hypothetical protein